MDALTTISIIAFVVQALLWLALPDSNIQAHAAPELVTKPEALAA